MKLFKDNRLQCWYVSEDYNTWCQPCICEDGSLEWYAIHYIKENGKKEILGYAKTIVELAEKIGYDIDFCL